MMNKYVIGSLGVGFGMLVAIPLFTHAAKEGPSHDYKAVPAVFSQACVEAMAATDDMTLTTLDDEAKAKKAALMARSAALRVAATIKDDSKRADAVKVAKKAYNDATHSTPSAELKEGMKAQILACGNKEKKFTSGPVPAKKMHASSSSRMSRKSRGL